MAAGKRKGGGEADRIRRVLRNGNRIKDLADQLCWDLRILERSVERLLSDDRGPADVRPQVSAYPAGGAAEFERLPDGRAQVRVDRGKWVVLPPALADLFWLLFKDNTLPSGGPIDGWKPIAVLIEELDRGAKHPTTHHALENRVYRLRKLLAAAGYGWNLVQFNAKSGYRILLWTGAGFARGGPEEAARQATEGHQ